MKRGRGIILTKSLLARNIYKALISNLCDVDLASHIEDMDVLLSEKSYRWVIVGDDIFENAKWKGLEARNPDLKNNIKKVFITSGGMAPDGFFPVKRPFPPEEAIKLLCDIYPSEKGHSPYLSSQAGGFKNRRVFGRGRLTTEVYLNDEDGRPIIYLMARDISLGGMFVEGMVQLRRGSLVFLSFNVSGHPVSITGEVVRRTKDGAGIRFMGLDEGARRLIAAHCGR